MIRQQFVIPGYDWLVNVWYHVDDYYTDEILEAIERMCCPVSKLQRAYENLSSEQVNKGLCYSNYRSRESVMVISDTSSPEEFANSYDHEKRHLERHIEEAFGIAPYGEEAAYLAGNIGQAMFRKAKLFMCECHGIYRGRKPAND